jgi:cell division protein FtsA
MGVALVDIGGGTTAIAIFSDGGILRSVVLRLGGNDFTNDIAICLRAPFSTSDEAKKKYGHAIPGKVPPDETIELAVFGGESKRNISRRLLSQIIEARAEQIFGFIFQEIKRSGYEGLLPAGVVLCGGTAELAGIREFGQEILQLPVRIGFPQGIHGLVDSISGPAYAASVGLLLWGLRHGAAHPARETLLHRLIRWFKEVFSTE